MGHYNRLRMWSDDFHDLVLRFSPPMVVKGNMNQGVYGVNSTYNVERCGKKESNVKILGIKVQKFWNEKCWNVFGETFTMYL